MLKSVEQYLASVPGGIDAYPECLHKGEPLGVWLERCPLGGLSERIPAQAAELLKRRGALPTWVPEVHAAVLYLAIREAHFPDDEAFLVHARACNRAVLETPVNRIVFWVASPRAILRGGSVRWGSFHKGSSIDVRSRGDQSAELTLTFPPHLLPEIVVRGNGEGFRCALEYAGARDVALNVRVLDPTRALFEAQWR